MRHKFLCAAVFAANFLVGTVAMADTTPAPSTSAPASTDAKPADDLSRALGSISAFDATAKTITLSGFGGDDTSYTIDDNTKYMLDIPATVSDIKVGDTLRAYIFGGGGAADAASGSITPNFLNIVPPVDVKGRITFPIDNNYTR
jgi:hypothetical protein